MTTTLTARGPEDLLAAVPVVLGFRPHDSLVMLTFDAARTFHARVDLPPPAEAEAALPELVDALVSPCLTHRVGRVAFVSYSDDAGLSARVATALRAAFGRAGIGVIDVLRAHAGAWRRVPVRPGGRESEAVPYDEAAHPFAAQAVFEGRVTLASREDLRDTLAPDPEAVARVTKLQAGVADSGLGRRRLGGRPGRPVCRGGGDTRRCRGGAGVACGGPRRRPRRGALRRDAGVRAPPTSRSGPTCCAGHPSPRSPTPRPWSHSVPGRRVTERSPGARSTAASTSTPTIGWVAVWPSASPGPCRPAYGTRRRTSACGGVTRHEWRRTTGETTLTDLGRGPSRTLG